MAIQRSVCQRIGGESKANNPLSVDYVAFGGYLVCTRRGFSISSLRFAMPIYEYKCNKCGVFEAIQGIKEAPLKKCPTCKSKVERQMSRGSFILKGSGWYATDYAKKSTPSTTESDSSAAPATPATEASPPAADSAGAAPDNKPIRSVGPTFIPAR